MENPAANESLIVSAILADPAKWRSLLNEFEEVLNLNIFLVDSFGRVLIPANFTKNQQEGGLHFIEKVSGEGRFGFSLVRETFSLEFEGGEIQPHAVDLSGQKPAFLERFDPYGSCFQILDPFDLRLFAAPVVSMEGKTLFYLMIGPLCVGQFWPEAKYRALADSLGLMSEEIVRKILSVPQISEAALSAMLDLLAEVIKDVGELALEKQKFTQMQNRFEAARPEILTAVEDVLSEIQQDELLIAILDAAIKMTSAQSGSLMIFDEIKQEFAIKVSRGLENKKSIVQSRLKLGEGIAGIAAQEKAAFFISGTEGDSRIRHLLRRPDIKESFVIPIILKDKVVGILNLSLKESGQSFLVSGVQQDIQKFSPLIAAALRTL